MVSSCFRCLHSRAALLSVHFQCEFAASCDSLVSIALCARFEHNDDLQRSSRKFGEVRETLFECDRFRRKIEATAVLERNCSKATVQSDRRKGLPAESRRFKWQRSLGRLGKIGSNTPMTVLAASLNAHSRPRRASRKFFAVENFSRQRPKISSACFLTFSKASVDFRSPH